MVRLMNIQIAYTLFIIPKTPKGVST
jgi:hypothetical protein